MIKDMRGLFAVYCETESEKRLRVDWFWDKEPETLLWIDNMERGAVLWDVGANVGMYSLYAAAMGKAVYAFEAEKRNYGRLVENVSLNGWMGVIWTIRAMLGDAGEDGSRVGWLGVPVDAETGSSGSQIGGRGDMQPCTLMSGRWAVRRGILFPSYVKIDIDGLELEVLRGMGDMLEHPALLGLLVEVNNLDVIPYMMSKGWVVDHKLTNQRIRVNDTNYIFKRR